MITSRVESGICGFSSLVRVFKIKQNHVKIVIESDCEQIKALGEQLQELGMGVREVLTIPINENPVYEMAGRCNLHAGCAVPCGVIKAAEIALGLALIKDVKIVFQNDSKV